MKSEFSIYAESKEFSDAVQSIAFHYGYYWNGSNSQEITLVNASEYSDEALFFNPKDKTITAGATNTPDYVFPRDFNEIEEVFE